MGTNLFHLWLNYKVESGETITHILKGKASLKSLEFTLGYDINWSSASQIGTIHVFSLLAGQLESVEFDAFW